MMPLIKQTIDVPFGLGIDTQTDEKVVLPGKLITLENAVFDKIGRVAKRAGLVAESPLPTSLAAPANGTLYAGQNDLVVREAPSGVATARRINTQDVQIRTPSRSIFNKLEADILAPALYTSSLIAAAQPDGCLDQVGRQYGLAATGPQLTLFDYLTKVPVFTSGPRTTSVDVTTKVLPSGVTGEFIVATVSNSSTINIFANVKASGTTIVAGVGGNPWSGGTAPVANASIAAAVAVSPNDIWDWCLDSAGAFLYFVTQNGATMTIRRYNTSSWAATTATLAVTATSIGCALNGNTLGIVYTTAAGISFTSYNATTLAVITAPVALAGAPSVAYELSTIAANGAGFYVHIQESMTVVAPYAPRRVVWSAITSTGTGFVAKYINGAGLASKMGADSTTLAVTYDTSLQRSLLFYKFDDLFVDALGPGDFPSLQGRTLYTRHGGLMNRKFVPTGQDVKVNSAANELERDFFTAQFISQASTATAVTPNPTYGVGWVQAQQASGIGGAGSARSYPSAQMNGETLFGGGVLHRVTPAGPEIVGTVVYPEIVSLPTGAGGSIPDGTYSVIATYETVNADGSVWESAPSPPVSLTISGGGGTRQINAFVQPYRFETRLVYVVLYITLNGGTTYYRAMRSASINDRAFNVNTYIIQSVAAPLSSSAILYSQGEQENQVPDGPSALCSDRDRIWCVPGSQRTRVLPSKPFVQGYELAFFPDVFRQLPAEGDAILCLQRQDDRLYAFKSQTTHEASGSGPDATGNNDDLSDFSVLYTNVGANNGDSVLKAPLGLYVKSSTDIWFIGRDKQLSRIGADVESYTASQNLRSIAYCSVERQIRFLFGREAQSHFELIYSEESQSWSYNTRQASVDSAVGSLAYFNGMAYYVLPVAAGASALYREDPTIFTDIGVGYSFKVVTAWLKPAQVLQGFGRIYRALLLGDNLASHTLQVRVRFDFETAWSETHTISSANATVGGSAWQPELRFIRQKCESFQLEISDTSPTGQAFNLSGLELTVGAKPGSKRTPAQKRF